jgi:hypothetical protein
MPSGVSEGRRAAYHLWQVPLAAVRNIAIILVIAAAVAFIPGGGTASNVVLQAVSLLFLAVLGWFASIMYRQHRASIYSLGDRRRAIVYLALAVALVTLSATHRLWNTSAGSVAWLVLIGACLYAVIAIVWAARRY